MRCLECEAPAESEHDEGDTQIRVCAQHKCSACRLLDGAS